MIVINKSIDEQKLSIALLKVIMKYLAIDKAVRNFGTDVPIYNAEIHMVSMIAENPGVHIRGLAEEMDISSASVSEIVRKLEKKKLIYKETDAKNLSRLALFVTEKGETAHKEHLRYHDIFETMITRQLDGAKSDELAFLSDFLSGLLLKMDCFEEEI